MLTRLRTKNFKVLRDVDIELGKTVVLIGPNNSGKTTALQALALWDIGLRQWSAKRSGKTSPEKRPGVTINRRDLISIPVPDANLLWRDLHVRDVERVGERQQTQNIRIDIIIDGVTNGKAWSCGLEFDYANQESFYCRPLRLTEEKQPRRMAIPPGAADVRVAFLPPMSGLADREYIKQPGEIDVLIGQGQTAQVLRNLCYQIYEKESARSQWKELVDHIHRLFGVTLLLPEYLKERSEITMAYKEKGGTQLDLASAGRGLHQTLLLLAHLYANPRSILLLDEPDAHLEVLRQRQTYQLLTEVAEKQGSQIIAASHSEVVLNEAADRDMVIAFVGKPHRIDDRGSQVLKALKEIGYDQFYLAEEKGWVLYLEGSTDLAILKAFADTLNHEAANLLEQPFVNYVGNQPTRVREHFWGLKEAKQDLVGVALFDRFERSLPDNLGAVALQWRRREIENYLCMEDVLLAYACGERTDDLFADSEAKQRESVMSALIADLVPPIALRDPSHHWWLNTKITDDFLDPLFEMYFKKLRLPNMLSKTDYHILARLVPKEKIDAEISEKLDAIAEIARKAKPRKD
jgi:ABC-type lipoprotein export system ATPase subunit